MNEPLCHVTALDIPTAHGKQGQWGNKSLSGKTHGIWKFAKTQGNLFAQVTAIFAAKIAIFSPEVG